MKSSHITSPRKRHFYLKKEAIEIPFQEVRRSGRYFGENGMNIKTVKERFHDIINNYEQRSIQYSDKRYYFIITFTFPITSEKWNSIYEDLHAKIIHIYNEKNVKMAVVKPDLDIFLQSLIKYRRYIKDITKKSQEKIIDEKLEKLLEENKITNVTISTVYLSGLKKPEVLVEELNKKIETFEKIVFGYRNSQKAILKGRLLPSTIKSIVEDIETITSIEQVPKINLTFVSNKEYDHFISTNSRSQIDGLIEPEEDSEKVTTFPREPNNK